MGCFSPADVAVGCRRNEERHHAIARTTGIVRHNTVLVVDVLVDFVDNPVGVQRRFIGVEDWQPFGHPRLACRRDPRCSPQIATVFTNLGFHFLDQHFERQPGVANKTNM